MKLEFIPDGSPDAPLVRLFDFDADEAARLCEVFATLASSSVKSCGYGLDYAAFVKPVRGCRLVLTVGERDRGLFQVISHSAIGCAFVPDTWHHIRDLTQPFTETGKTGFQWLDRTNISWLLSSDGQW